MIMAVTDEPVDSVPEIHVTQDDLEVVVRKVEDDNTKPHMDDTDKLLPSINYS